MHNRIAFLGSFACIYNPCPNSVPRGFWKLRVSDGSLQDLELATDAACLRPAGHFSVSEGEAVDKAMERQFEGLSIDHYIPDTAKAPVLIWEETWARKLATHPKSE
ncbi:hypothetical protein [Arthrobacter sp. yr096]|uniref:hypothetical protein n=1 Tax=Arthrobacter sp. yr096 TaxID=1761750 RepID=UPI000B803117|nr:hypothetical protein [Arthrobacter sp. yr096]